MKAYLLLRVFGAPVFACVRNGLGEHYHLVDKIYAIVAYIQVLRKRLTSVFLI